MKSLLLSVLVTCVCTLLQAQVNYVPNGDLEKFSKCPEDWSRIYYANGWRNATDSIMGNVGMEYYNSCGNSTSDPALWIPNNGGFWQYPHSDSGMAGFHLYYDKSGTKAPLPLPFNYRDYLQTRLARSLVSGKSYCLTFWIVNTEGAGYAHNKIGAYLDNGAINSIADTAGQEITSVTPQIYTNDIIADTMNWSKIEGTFVATGTETFITIGNFFPNAAILKTNNAFWYSFEHYSYYLIDDISVVESDLPADAGPDTWVAAGKKVLIGRATDTTATAIDCKWWHKGSLIDSGAVISVNANPVVGSLDTYIVIQTVCGLVKTDTCVVKTVPLGVQEFDMRQSVYIFPNPGSGIIQVQATALLSTIRIMDLSGRNAFYQEDINSQTLSIQLPQGFYVAEIQTEDGSTRRQKIIIQ